jgi:hypothetical protein
MRHFKDPAFRPLFDALPARVQRLAERILRCSNAKRIRDDLWSVRVGRSYRSLAIESDDGFQWFWIGSHTDYDDLIG